jgi:hypothetical protein
MMAEGLPTTIEFMTTLAERLARRILNDPDIPEKRAFQLSLLDPVVRHLCELLDDELSAIRKRKPHTDEA